MEKRAEQSKWARKLQEILGSDYMVLFDACESGMTDVFFKGILVKSVRNREMKGSMNVYDYTVDYKWKREHGIIW